MLEWTACLPEEAAREVVKGQGMLREIRLRAGKRVQLAGDGRDWFCGEPISTQQLRAIAVAMMDHSYYAREEELSQGFFTLRDGCRVGVCGSYSIREGRIVALRDIGSLCIRIAREVRGCARAVAERMLKDGFPRSALIVSAPGYGKTTMLRDAARILSESGYAVGIVDERHEIAACSCGVPTMDVGARSDVSDGCPRALALERMVRAMAPQVVVTDEIGAIADLDAVRSAACRGVAVLASAHAGSLDEMERGMLRPLWEEGWFRLAFFLGGAPGRIQEIREFGKGATG